MGRRVDMSASSIADVVADLNETTESESERLAQGERVGVFAPFTAGMGAFWREFFVGGAWKSGPRGWVRSGLAAMEKTVLLIKVYFEQHRRDS